MFKELRHSKPFQTTGSTSIGACVLTPPAQTRWGARSFTGLGFGEHEQFPHASVRPIVGERAIALIFSIQRYRELANVVGGWSGFQQREF